MLPTPCSPDHIAGCAGDHVTAFSNDPTAHSFTTVSSRAAIGPVSLRPLPAVQSEAMVAVSGRA